MLYEKRSELEAMKDEVAEHHPLLQKLLTKLPDVTRVECTHGISEMGADFVILKVDKALGTTEHIGAIAITGRIVQDFSDIERMPYFSCESMNARYTATSR